MGAVHTDMRADDPDKDYQGPGLTRQPVPRIRYQALLESSDDGLSENDAAGEGYIPQTWAPDSCHPDIMMYVKVERDCPTEIGMSCNGRLLKIVCSQHLFMRHHDQKCLDAIQIAHIAKMQDFQGGDRLDTFFDHIKEVADFYRRNEPETWRQARAHLLGMALAYMNRAPFQSQTWKELKALLLKRFQPRDFMATYKS